MATRSEQFRADEQRHSHNKPKNSGKESKVTGPTKQAPRAESRPRARTHTERKAAYALEETEPGKRPSRKSSRKSANRAKPDTSFNLIEEIRKGSPKARFEKASARDCRPRSSPRGS